MSTPPLLQLSRTPVLIPPRWETQDSRIQVFRTPHPAVNGLPTVLAKLAQAPQSPVTIVVAQHTPGGVTWGNLNADPTVDQLIQQGWDTVVLQDQSQQPWVYKGDIKPELSSLNTKITATGASTLLYMTWARQASILPSRFAMDMAVNNYYERHAAVAGASVAPVGRGPDGTPDAATQFGVGGGLSDVRLFDRALNQAELQSL